MTVVLSILTESVIENILNKCKSYSYTDVRPILNQTKTKMQINEL